MRAPRRTRPAVQGLSLLLAAAFAAPAMGQEATGGEGDAGNAAPRRGMVFTPRLGVSQTITDNLMLSPAGQRDTALVSAITPGINIAARTALVRGTLDYSLDGIVYTKTDQKNRLQNQLRAQGTLDLIPSQLMVDVSGNITRQSISAFGPQTTSRLLDNGNQTEMRQVGLSPRWRGQIGGLLSFDLRGDLTWRDARKSIVGDGHDESLSLSLASLRTGKLVWGVTASAQRFTFEQTSRTNRSESVNGTLDWQPDVDWRLGVSGGRERSDYLGSVTTGTYGLRAGWSPGPRTTLSADWQHHSYGDSHNLSFEHRMSRLVLRLGSGQSVTGTNGPSGVMTNYELFNLQFMSLEPDPVKRDTLVRNTLAALGLSADAVGTGGFLGSGPMLTRRNDLSLAWQGQRLTLTLAANDNRSRRLGAAPTTGDLALSSMVQQRSGSLSVGYRFTPLTSASLSYSEQRNRGDASVAGSRLRTLAGNVSVRLGQRTDAVLGARTAQSEGSPFNTYKENALYLQLTQRF